MTRRIPPTFLAGAGLTAQRTSPRSHAYDVPVVRELPSLPGAALDSAQTW